MDINKTKSGNELNVKVAGRLDTNTAPELEQAIIAEVDGLMAITLDLADLDYISSAGLRVVLMLHKTMASKKGTLTIKHPKEEVMEVFDMTGFSSFLNIEE